MHQLKETIEALYERNVELDDNEVQDLLGEFLRLLNSGKIRAAEPGDDGWKVNAWVKKGILVGFRTGRLKDFSEGSFRFFDKHTYPLRDTLIAENVRLVPGGTSIRTGSYLAPGVVVMPPAYVNVGAYVGESTMVDSHALVGSCAQIGARVHLSAGSQIGGVLEPVGAAPVVIEDDVMVGGNCGIYEGTRIGQGAVIGAGTILTASIPVYDLVREQTLRGGQESPLSIPAGAVVIPGSRPVEKNDYAASLRLHAACALIVKYRDERTDAATALEDALR